MKKLKLSFIIFSLTAFILSSCSQHIFDFTLVSTKNVDLSKAGTFMRTNTRVKGEDGVYMVIYIPLGMPNVKTAIDKAIESTPGAIALIDCVVISKSWWAVLTGYTAYVVEGTALIDPSLVLNNEKSSIYGKIELDRNGEIKNIESLSSNEYLALKSKVVKESQEIKFANSEEIK